MRNVNLEEQQYLDVLRDIIDNGIETENRTGINTKFIVGTTLKYDLSNHKIPIWTTRKINYKNQWWELLWFLNGRTDVKWLQDKGVNIWNSWVKSDGTIGPGYGKQFRNWEAVDWTKEVVDEDNGEIIGYKTKHIDQFKNLIERIKKDPNSRRHIISLWNVPDMEECALPSCHGLVIQFIVEKNKYLHCVYYMRSSDFGVGYCAWQYALLTNIVGRLTNLEPKSLTAVLGNNHVYINQIEALNEQLKRIPTEFPTLEINPNIKTIKDVENSCFEDYKLIGYNPQSFIKIPVSI